MYKGMATRSRLKMMNIILLKIVLVLECDFVCFVCLVGLGGQGGTFYPLT